MKDDIASLLRSVGEISQGVSELATIATPLNPALASTVAIVAKLADQLACTLTHAIADEKCTWRGET